MSKERKAKGKSNANASKGKMLQRVHKSSQVNCPKRSRRAHEELKGKLTEVVTKSSRRSYEQTARSARKSVWRPSQLNKN